MVTITNQVTNETIRAAAIAAGYADASVVRYVELRPYRLDGPPVSERTWLSLALKRRPDSRFEVVGRRQTRVELLRLVQRYVGR